MAYRSTKRYGHEVGLSASFRQWRADSHCALIHGYALAFTFVFEAAELDHRNWVVDFGGLAYLKNMLRDTFDHKLLVAQDDPQLSQLMALDSSRLASVVVLPNVGCEAFAEVGYGFAVNALFNLGVYKQVKVISCEVSEHGANSAIYYN